MKTSEVLARCETADIYLRFVAGHLQYYKSAGKMPEELKLELSAVAAELVGQYEKCAAIHERAGGLDRESAERLAAADVLGDVWAEDIRMAHIREAQKTLCQFLFEVDK